MRPASDTKVPIVNEVPLFSEAGIIDDFGASAAWLAYFDSDGFIAELG
jgi:hypothetical protein